MHPFILLAVAAIGGLLLGIKLGRERALMLCLGALAIAVACFVAYAGMTNYAREVEDSGLRRIAQTLAMPSWAGLYVATGAFGPAMLQRPSPAVALSIFSTLIAGTIGTVVMFNLACAFAGECL